MLGRTDVDQSVVGKIFIRDVAVFQLLLVVEHDQARREIQEGKVGVDRPDLVFVGLFLADGVEIIGKIIRIGIEGLQPFVHGDGAFAGHIVADGVGAVGKVALGLEKVVAILFAGGIVDAELFQMEIEKLFGLHRHSARNVHIVERDGLQQGKQLVFFGNIKGHRAVVRRADAGDALDPVAFAAGEQPGDVVRVGRRLLVRIAVRQQMQQQPRGHAAVAVADQVHLAFGREPAFKQRLVIGPAEAAVVVAFGMGFAVVHRGTHQTGIEFTRTVPRRGHRADRERIALIIVFGKIFHQVACGRAPIRDLFVQTFVHAPAEHSGNENKRILILCHAKSHPSK